MGPGPQRRLLWGIYEIGKILYGLGNLLESRGGGRVVGGYIGLLSCSLVSLPVSINPRD